MANYSITKRLIIFLLIPSVAIILLAGGLGVYFANRTVNQLHDRALQNGAELLTGFLLYEFREHEQEQPDEEDEVDKPDDEEDSVEDLTEIVSELEQERQIASNFRIRLGSKTLFSSSAVASVAACTPGFSTLENRGKYSGKDPTKMSASAVANDWRCFQRVENAVASNKYIIVEVFDQISDRKKEIRQLLVAAILPFSLLPLVIVAH